MGDADDSYDFTNLTPFLEKLRQGYDLVMGNRFKGGIKPGAMPRLPRYLGNPVLTWIGKLFFKSNSSDFHCGLRGFKKDAIEKLNLHTTGMEFASEMVVKASLYNLKITEVPTTLSPDGHSRPPHLRSWRDGWRHLRFLLGLLPEDKRLKRLFQYINLETGLIIGVVLFLIGVFGSFIALYIWESRSFGSLNPAQTMRIVIPSVTSLALGIQVIFSSFFLSVLGLKRR